MQAARPHQRYGCATARPSPLAHLTVGRWAGYHARPQPSGSPSLAICLGAGFEPARVGPRLRRVLAVPICERREHQRGRCCVLRPCRVSSATPTEAMYPVLVRCSRARDGYCRAALPVSQRRHERPSMPWRWTRTSDDSHCGHPAARYRARARVPPRRPGLYHPCYAPPPPHHIHSLGAVPEFTQRNLVHV